MDELFTALADRQRRQILATLEERDSRTDHLTVGDVGSESAELDKSVELLHVHLPMLDDVGIVEWDREASVVSPGTRFDDAARVLACLREFDGESPAN